MPSKILCPKRPLWWLALRAGPGLLLNGRVFPPLHRVVITGKEDRHAAGLFLLPKEGLIINAPEEMVDDEHPRLYKPFDFEAYFAFTYTDTKKRDLSALKTYCSL
ncbi:unnamed protein product [Eruca vesicaria subsp. sativa]|uniref:Isopenicillin N synthase-like Fe(2+) 2OG dioxygenase domain-containing protein n=1 Tax=Eruca vesicaria subsp. sativa TaxID=29727 RepID=A0ABC8KM06_ERUVS|nr:unnamed protein product [Eruca vesicaria subsp. sativa]